MQKVIFILCGSLIVSGCTSLFSKHDELKNGMKAEKQIVRLDESVFGLVAKANANFVVLTFPFGGMPATGQLLNVYREGKKVAELRVTGPQRDINTVADIVSGQIELNDEVRAD